MSGVSRSADQLELEGGAEVRVAYDQLADLLGASQLHHTTAKLRLEVELLLAMRTGTGAAHADHQDDGAVAVNLALAP